MEEDIRRKYNHLTKTLIAKGLTISTMESATSGQIASLITDTEGSSAVFTGGYVSYSNEVKIRLGVPAEIINKYSVYSQETALEMARVCRRDFAADIGIGVTGTMGNVDPANPQASKPGEVYFAFEFADRAEAYSASLLPQPTRLAYKLAVAGLIYEALIEQI